MSEIPSQFDRWMDSVNRLVVKASSVKIQYKTAYSKLEEAQSRLEAVEEAQTIVQTVAQNIQERVHTRIASVVTRCLAAVFENPYQFKILFERKRGRTEAILVFERDGWKIEPMFSSGGGPKDVAAFALRLSCMMLSRPKLHPIVVLDEPFKSPSPHYRERIKALMEILSQEMGVQFIMVTNIMELVTGEVIDLGD